MDDEKTVLKDDEAAIILTDDWLYKLRIPRNYTASGVHKVKDTHVMMMALFIRLRKDSKFNEELREWFDENKEQVLSHLGFTEKKLN